VTAGGEPPAARLFHFSEDPGILRFDPHVPETNPDEPPLVWAISEEHVAHYLFPRDCPRVCFWPGSETTREDRERFFTDVSAGKVIAIESAWLDRVRSAKLYQYEMPAETFTLRDRFAGYFVSQTTVVPTRVEPAGDLLSRLAASGVELRFVPSLLPLRDRLVASTVEFSMIRLRNASPVL